MSVCRARMAQATVLSSEAAPIGRSSTTTLTAAGGSRARAGSPHATSIAAARGNSRPAKSSACVSPQTGSASAAMALFSPATSFPSASTASCP